MTFSRQARIESFAASVIFLIVFVIQAMSVYSVSSDSRAVLPTALSIINQGNTDLDEFPELLAPTPHYTVTRIDGHAYNVYPIGTPLVAVPFVAAGRLFTSEEAIRTFPSLFEKRIASALVAITAVLLYFIARTKLGRSRAALAALLFAFCTAAWSSASRGLWQHAPSMLVLTAALGLLVAARRFPRLIPPVGTLLAFSYVIRPTNSLAILFFSLYVLLRHRRQFVGFALCALPVAVLFFGYTYSIHHQFLSPYYRINLGNGASYGEGIAGVLFSPSRGLLVYSPVFLFSLVGIVIKLRDRSFGLLDGCLCGIIGANILVVGTFISWWGGHCYGYRLLTDLVPFLVFFLIPVLAMPPRPLGTALFGLLAGISLWMHAQGANSVTANTWNILTPNIDFSPARRWDWRYPPFLAGFIDVPAATNFPVLPADTRIDLQRPEAVAYLDGEWIEPDGGLRWCTTGRADLCFTLERPVTLTLAVRAPVATGTYRLSVVVNDHAPQTVTLTAGVFQTIRIPLAADRLRSRNTISFRFPDAPDRSWLVSRSHQPGLGLGVQWIEANPLPFTETHDIRIESSDGR